MSGIERNADIKQPNGLCLLLTQSSSSASLMMIGRIRPKAVAHRDLA